MEAVVKIRPEYRDQEWMFVAKYNSFYDIYYSADSSNDSFGFVLVDRLKGRNPDGDWYLMMYKRGKFAFREGIGLFLSNIECMYGFIKKAGIVINGMGLAHIINLKKNKLI